MARTVREKNTPAMLLSDWVSLNSLPGCYAPGPFLLGHLGASIKGRLSCSSAAEACSSLLILRSLTSLSLCNRHSFLVLPCDLHYTHLIHLQQQQQLNQSRCVSPLFCPASLPSWLLPPPSPARLLLLLRLLLSLSTLPSSPSITVSMLARSAMSTARLTALLYVEPTDFSLSFLPASIHDENTRRLTRNALIGPLSRPVSGQRHHCLRCQVPPG